MSAKENPIKIETNKEGVFTKESLKENLLSLKDNAEKFLKNDETIFYNYSDLPEEYKEKLGDVDNAKYTPEYLENSLVVYQTKKDGTEDIYPIPQETFKRKYKIIESDKKGIEGVDIAYIGLKIEPVSMLKSKYYLGNNGKIESPWGGTQDFDKHSYIVLGDGEVYICQMDEKTNLPINYIKYEDTNTVIKNTSESLNDLNV